MFVVKEVFENGISSGGVTEKYCMVKMITNIQGGLLKHDTIMPRKGPALTKKKRSDKTRYFFAANFLFEK